MILSLPTMFFEYFWISPAQFQLEPVLGGRSVGICNPEANLHEIFMVSSHCVLVLPIVETVVFPRT
jgi:hypothetical protein